MMAALPEMGSNFQIRLWQTEIKRNTRLAKTKTARAEARASQ
jgi:hypothetical protein